MTRRNVVVTGLGAVTAAGLGAEALWPAAWQGLSGVRQGARNEEYRRCIPHTPQTAGGATTAPRQGHREAF